MCCLLLFEADNLFILLYQYGEWLPAVINTQSFETWAVRLGGLWFGGGRRPWRYIYSSRKQSGGEYIIKVVSFPPLDLELVHSGAPY